MTNPELRDRILAMDDLGREDVEIPEWENEIMTVRGLTAGEVEEFGRQSADGQLPADLMASIVSKVVINGDGGRVFTDEDVAALAAKNPTAIKRLFDAASRVSKLEEELAGN